MRPCIRHLPGAAGDAAGIGALTGRVARRDPAVHHLPVGVLPLPPLAGFAADRFHPSPTGCRAWGRALAASVGTVLDA